MRCPVCNEVMRQRRIRWRWDCFGCGFLASDLEPAIHSAGTSALDEAQRACALAPLRQSNFGLILDRIETYRSPRRRRLLDVGCAHGWFLELARQRGYDAQGIEPDESVAGLAKRRGLDVRVGFFPEDLPAGEYFDFVVFNDVLEHLPDPRLTLRHVRERLGEAGILVVNLPSSRGPLYRAASLLGRMGMPGPHDRLWQVGFPSPHVSYFHPDALARLAHTEGFKEVDRGDLPLYDVPTLWYRLRMDRALRLPSAAVTWLALTLLHPILRWMPSDVTYQIFAVSGGQELHKVPVN